MKLELKHLAGYLPYGLIVRVEDYKRDYVGREFDEVVGFHQWDSLNLFWSVLTDGGSKPSIDKIKPILRPLSDLTKEIEVNGEKFVPKEYLQYNYIGESIGMNVATFSHRLVQKLLEWHFDIYGLIENNLAIDINTLKP